MKYYLAIDIGASSGRHILGYIENEKLRLEEIYRFENNLIEQNGSLVWNIENLVSEVKSGIKKCMEIGKIPTTIAIDTWGVDYVLLDENKQELLPAYCYRDSRTKDIVSQVESIISSSELYAKTGIQKQNFNTIYQIYADKISGKLGKAKYFLMMPEYLSFKLTGKIQNEYTNASTTGMLNALEKTWDKDIIEKLELPQKLFGKLNLPSTALGEFSEDIKNEFGFNSTVVFAPSHDTASAVAATPMCENDLYISSGTWSLIGTELKSPILTFDSQIANFTNEGGVDFRFRFLKNYMGMWLLQNIRRNLNKKYTYDEMMELAKSNKNYEYIDVNAPILTAPKDMICAIKELMEKTDAELSYILNSVYHSLAQSYKDATMEIESITDRKINAIHIVGGGCQDKYLNQLTAKYTGKQVTAGPVEATAVGNLISQIMYSENITLEKARELVKTSFDIKEVH